MEKVQVESLIVKRDDQGEIIAIVAYNPIKRTRILYKTVIATDDDWMDILKGLETTVKGSVIVDLENFE